MNWQDRISIDPRINHGKPSIKGTRVTVSVIVGSVAEGDTVERILNSWPQLTAEDVTAALRFASRAAAEAGVSALRSDAE